MAKFKVGDHVQYTKPRTLAPINAVIERIDDNTDHPYRISYIVSVPYNQYGKVDVEYTENVSGEFLRELPYKDTKQELEPYTFKVIAEEWKRYVEDVRSGMSDHKVMVNSFNSYLKGINETLQVFPDDE